MSISNNREAIKYRLSDEDLSLHQLLYLVNKNGLKNQLDINGGFRQDRIIDLLSRYIDINDIDDIIDNAYFVNDDLLSLSFELSQIKKKDLRTLLQKRTKVHVPSASLIEGIFLYLPLDFIKKELDYDGPTIVTKTKPKKSKKSTTKKQIVSKGDKTTRTISFEVDRSNLESKLSEYDIDYLLDIIFNNKEYFDSIKNLSRNEFDKKMVEENPTKEKLIKTILEKISYQVLVEYFNLVVYKFFPSKTYKEPRDYQIETISQIYNAIEKGYKYIVLEAVSGYGKSLIAATLARIYSEEKTYILTTTNQLLTPYTELFNEYDFFKLQARYNFDCKKQGGRCSINACQDNCKYKSNFTCEYLDQLKRGLDSDTIICTYDYFFRNAFYHYDELEHRKLLICDEGHNIDYKISSGVSLEIYENRLYNLGLNTKKERRYLKLSENHYNFILKMKGYYEEAMKRNSLRRGTYKALTRRNYKRDIINMKKFLQYFERHDGNLSFEYKVNETYDNSFNFAPVKVNKFVPEVISNYADVCIFMSSSFFDLENFAYDLGLDESEVFKITVPNIFDLSNNPITIYDDLEMDYENLIDGNKEKAIPIIKDILEKHKNDKGIIHTFSNECAEFLKNNLNERRCMVSYGGDREGKLEEFKRSNDNSVLISPSMDEGVDLNDEDCKFQIIFKLPYPPYKVDFNDKRKALEDGKEWYRYKMLTRLIQAYGRGIRSENDSCKTYILDSRLWKVILNDWENDTHLIPQYFINAIENYK